MKNRTLLLIVVLIAIALVIIVQSRRLSATAHVYRNGTYTIEKVDISLVDGHAETEVMPGSSVKVITQYFGNEAFGDLNDDGTQDVAFLITQTSGGSGVFFYLAVALKKGVGYDGINTILLGDRIAPQTTQFTDGVITVNYSDRNSGEPFTTTPSRGVSKYFRVIDGTLVESK